METAIKLLVALSAMLLAVGIATGFKGYLLLRKKNFTYKWNNISMTVNLISAILLFCSGILEAINGPI